MRNGLIDGTQVSYGQLNEFFPFGFTTFSLDSKQNLTQNRTKTGFMEWKIDWSRLKITPDVTKGKVEWVFPPMYSTNLDVEEVEPIPFDWYEVHDFKKGFFGLNLPSVVGQPSVFAGVINDNQLNPIFAIGMRIRTDDLEKEITNTFGPEFQLIRGGTYPDPYDTLPDKTIAAWYKPFPHGFWIVRLPDKVWSLPDTNHLSERIRGDADFFALNNLVINPDFTNKTVAWNFDAVKGRIDSTGTTNWGPENRIEFSMPMLRGGLCPSPFVLYATNGFVKRIWVGTVNDRTIEPAFVFGVRVTTN